MSSKTEGRATMGLVGAAKKRNVVRDRVSPTAQTSKQARHLSPRRR
jgi:hypothetical protein